MKIKTQGKPKDWSKREQRGEKQRSSTASLNPQGGAEEQNLELFTP
jgi:hypothetical protein